MPIVDVEIVLRRGETFRKEIVVQLANELGEIFQSREGGTWLKVQEFPENRYAENGGTAEGIYPIFVSILKSRLPDADEMQREIERITGVVAQICNRSCENVHVIYQPEGRGRVAFGGRIVS